MVGSRRRRPARAGRDGHDDDLAVWVAAARAGDADAFGRIWQGLSPRVHGYLRGRGVAGAEDLTSEVFLAAFASLRTFAGDAQQFRAWLFTIAHHKAVDELRRRPEHAEYRVETDPRTSASAESDALDSVLDPEVRAMLAVLTPDQREVLLLRALGDLSLEQVAETTGRTVGAVKQLHHRAVAAARRAADAQPSGWFPRARAGSPPRPVTSAASGTMAEM